MRILDVDSPRKPGRYLAATIRAEISMTNISELNVDEYRVMWRGLEDWAQGKAIF